MDETYDAYAEMQWAQDSNYADYLEQQNMATEKLTLYQKLHKIQEAVMGLGKDKAALTYKYVTGDKVLGEVKPLMNKYGLLLKQEVLSIENTRQDYIVGANTEKERSKSEILSKCMMRFTWVDIDTGDKDENLFGANGQNDWDKGVGSALTYSERYFLLKYFHIATDEDDIDNPDRKPENMLPHLLPNTEQWTKAIEYLNKPDANVSVIRQKYYLSVENEKELLKQTK